MNGIAASRIPAARPVADPDGLSLRLAHHDDAGAIIDLIVRENHRRPDPDQVRRRLLRCPAVVAFEDDRLVGFIHARRFAPDVVELSNMVIDSRARRHGIGSRMVRMMEDELVRHGYRAAVFANSWLHPANTPGKSAVARTFWHQMGYREVLRTHGGATALFVKHLAPP